MPWKTRKVVATNREHWCPEGLADSARHCNARRFTGLAAAKSPLTQIVKKMIAVDSPLGLGGAMKALFRSDDTEQPAIFHLTYRAMKIARRGGQYLSVKNC